MRPRLYRRDPLSRIMPHLASVLVTLEEPNFGLFFFSFSRWLATFILFYFFLSFLG